MMGRRELLNDSYAVIREQILLMQPLQVTRQVYLFVLKQEKQVKVSLNCGNMNHHTMLENHNNKMTQTHQVQR